MGALRFHLRAHGTHFSRCFGSRISATGRISGFTVDEETATADPGHDQYLKKTAGVSSDESYDFADIALAMRRLPPIPLSEGVLARNAAGDVVEIRYPGGAERQLIYNESGALSEIKLNHPDGRLSGSWRGGLFKWQHFEPSGRKQGSYAQAYLAVDSGGNLVCRHRLSSEVFIERPDGSRTTADASLDKFIARQQRRVMLQQLKAAVGTSLFMALLAFWAMCTPGILTLSLVVSIAACTPFLLVHWGFGDEPHGAHFHLVFWAQVFFALACGGITLWMNGPLFAVYGVLLTIYALINLYILTRDRARLIERQLVIPMEGALAIVGVAVVLTSGGR